MEKERRKSNLNKNDIRECSGLFGLKRFSPTENKISTALNEVPGSNALNTALLIRRVR